MGYLSDEHQRLSNSQQSKLVSWVQKLPFDRKVTVIGVSLLIGILSAAMAWKGEVSDRVYFCLKTPTSELRCHDKNNRPYRMTVWNWKQWKQDGQPDIVIFKELVKGNNTNKPVLALYAFIEFAIAGWLLRHLQNDERQLAQFQEVVEKQNVVRAELQARTELEFTAHEYTVEIQKAEILAEVDIKISQMEANDLLFEAETAGMSEEQKREYVDFLRRQKTPYLQGSQTLQGTIDPKDKVEGEQEMMAINPHQWFEETIRYCSVLVFGGQDSGKTTLASHIIKARKDRGDRIIVLDPHAAKGQWAGLEVIGAGMDYQAIDNAFRWYYGECERRYKLLAWEGEEAVRALGRICVVTEELTNYADRCKHSGGYLQAAMSDNRKIFLDSLSISHNRTLSKLGGAKAIAQLRDDALLEIKLIPPSLNKPRQAFMKLPGQEFEPVLLPNWEMIRDFGSSSSPAVDRETLQRIWELEFNLDSETTKRQDETVKRSEINNFSIEEKRFTRFNLTRNDAKAEILRLRNEMNINQTEIIKILWDAKPGSTETYRNALSEYKELLSD
ncbi:hypothetical protein FACHB389_35280 [Nostoc calcicola FACHB-389]|nr:hypothetical protein FACHB389_35280 [Nostoc calcicola FACHB-389]